MKLLITGAAGFIGYHLTLKLLKKNFLVFGIDSMNSYYSRKLKIRRLKNLKRFRNFYFENINLCNYSKAQKIINHIKPDVIYHLAGQPGVLYSYKNPQSYTKNNIVATNNIIKIANSINIKKFIFSSSSSVYGDQYKFPINENAKLKPKNYYAVSKKICEQNIKKSLKASYIIFRFFTVYGSLGRPDMFFSIFLRSVYKNIKIKLYNFGNYYRDFTYIDDVTDILYKSLNLKVKNVILNLCSSKPVKMNSVLDILKDKIKKNFDVLYLDKRNGEILKTYGDNKKIRNLLSKKKFTNISKGLSALVKNFSKLEKKINLR